MRLGLGSHEGSSLQPDSDKSSREPIPLSAAGARRIVKVVDTFGCGRRRARLAAMGLTPGSEVTVCCNLGGPMVVEVRGSRLSLGQRLASKIMVEPLGTADGCDCSQEKVCRNKIE